MLPWCFHHPLEALFYLLPNFKCSSLRLDVDVCFTPHPLRWTLAKYIVTFKKTSQALFYGSLWALLAKIPREDIALRAVSSPAYCAYGTSSSRAFVIEIKNSIGSQGSLAPSHCRPPSSSRRSCSMRSGWHSKDTRLLLSRVAIVVVATVVFLELEGSFLSAARLKRRRASESRSTTSPLKLALRTSGIEWYEDGSRRRSSSRSSAL